MNKIFITGGSGFIGAKLCDSLTKAQNTLISLDTKKTDKNGINFQKIDLCDFESVDAICREYKVNTIIHCAGIAHQKVGSIDLKQYQLANSLATENLAKSAIAVNPDVHFIFLSSISVYGESDINGSVSEDRECNPSSDYALSKLDAEKRLKKLFNSGRLRKLDILRLAPVYDSAWSLNLDRRVFAPKKTVFLKIGSGKQEMSALSRKNLVDFIDFRLTQKIENQAGKPFCKIFNVCDERPYKFEEIIRVFKQSESHPNRLVVKVPLCLVWIVTRLTGLIMGHKRQWLHSCYDKLAYSLVFDNKKMLATGFKPKHSLASVFLGKSSGMS